MVIENVLKFVEFGQRAEQPDVPVVHPVRAADDGAAVTPEIPGDAEPRPEVVLVAALGHVDEGQRTREVVRIEVFVRRAVEALVAQPEIDGHVLRDAPVVLHERDVVVRRVLDASSRCWSRCMWIAPVRAAIDAGLFGSNGWSVANV